MPHTESGLEIIGLIADSLRMNVRRLLCFLTGHKPDMITGPREWADQAYNIARWTKMPRGGHFPAAEEPQLLATELREFFRPLRSITNPSSLRHGGRHH